MATYQVAVNRILLATTRPPGTHPDGLLTEAEIDDMELALRESIPPGDFARRLIAADQAAGAST